jgi:hypothetical protein
MRLRPLLFGIAVLSISVMTTTLDAQAKDQFAFQRGQRTRGNSFVLKAPLRSTSTTGTRVRALSKRELAKLIKSASKRCGCAYAAQDTEYSNSCLKSCVARYVGWSTVLSCGIACSGNAVGCAVCVGVHEWVVLGCLQYCVWRDVISYVDGPVASNRGRPTKRQAKPLVRSAGGASST